MDIQSLKLKLLQSRGVIIRGAAAFVVFGGLGILAVQASHAATFAADAEAESGTLSGNYTFGDTTGASGGAAVKFGPNATQSGKKFIEGVSSNGRYFVDQDGAPYLVQGDSPWALFADVSVSDAEMWAADRESHGINSAIISLIGAPTNGGNFASGATYDGVLPFNGGNVTSWNPAYWSRIDAMMTSLKNHGVTVFLYPIDGWTTLPGNAFYNKSAADCLNYGKMVAQRYASYPNIVWMSGGDYNGYDNTINTEVQNMLNGIRSTGDTRIFGTQLNTESLTTDVPFYEQLVGWNFAYSYNTPYAFVQGGYSRPAGARDPRPVMLGESHYEGEGSANPDLLRRQELWSLTSGGGGDFAGSQDWLFQSGWQNRLDTPWITQQAKIHQYFAANRWYDLVPDINSSLVTAGRGTFKAMGNGGDDKQNDYVTAAQTADKAFSAVYVPTSASGATTRTLTLSASRLPASYTAVWVDPTNATGATQAANIDGSGSVTTPSAAHSDGSRDWLLVIK